MNPYFGFPDFTRILRSVRGKTRKKAGQEREPRGGAKPFVVNSWCSFMVKKRIAVRLHSALDYAAPDVFNSGQAA
jgi:hypothetical protein